MKRYAHLATPEQIRTAVAGPFGTTVEEIKGCTRVTVAAEAREASIYLMRHLGMMHTPQIAHETGLGERHVKWALKKVRDAARIDPVFYGKIVESEMNLLTSLLNTTP